MFFEVISPDHAPCEPGRKGFRTVRRGKHQQGTDARDMEVKYDNQAIKKHCDHIGRNIVYSGCGMDRKYHQG